ncbi:hypothetical protein EPA93_26110 [Ktedonosporobacter rubrisoli]|uniref:Uncharacterized protein n=1 Tax=Ktedonosporobacter rubrisoli TaxID=2509675 RepID=A0A4V0YZC8_KTERU|nr:hypothetical protein [Ktedonosporobacter rubrisoli]QBD79271.1 hypothetical protein EPA93_26110 [Ktedonosporobacter rubrisoli]
MVADRRAKVVNILYYLHGLCTTQDLSQAAPNTNTQPDSAAIAGTRMPLLDCAQTPGDQHLGYIKHIISHLNGVLHAPGSTPAQAALANQIITALSNVNLKLEQIQQDAQQLIQMDDAHFQASPLLGEIEHLASQANGGWFDQGTGKTYAGTEAIYGMIQSLAAFDVQPFKAQ